MVLSTLETFHNDNTIPNSEKYKGLWAYVIFMMMLSLFSIAAMLVLFFSIPTIGVKAQVGFSSANLAHIGNRTLALLIKLNHDSTSYPKNLLLRLYDAKTNQTIQHVGYMITITNGHQTLLRGMFHSHSGILILKINSDYSTADITNINATHEPILNGWLANSNNIVYINASEFTNDESIYHIHTLIASMDKDNLILPSPDQPTFDFFTGSYDGDNQKTRIPPWFKNVTNWFSTGRISGNDFTSSLQYLIEQAVLQIPQTQSGSNTTTVLPLWIKVDAGKWSANEISDAYFSKDIQYLINNGFIKFN